MEEVQGYVELSGGTATGQAREVDGLDITYGTSIRVRGIRLGLRYPASSTTPGQPGEVQVRIALYTRRSPATDFQPVVDGSTGANEARQKHFL